MDISLENNNPQELTEKRKFIHSLIFPSFFLLILWLIKIIEYEFELDLYYYGIYPLKLKGLIGILTSPLIHGSFNHLIDNSISLFILSVAVFYFYRPIPYKIFFLTYIITGIWVWFGGRPAYHIGASGIIYGLASFLFFSGIIRKDIRLMAISMLVVFLYGSLIWGIFPLRPSISWESHLWGAIAGVILSIIYRKYGPQRIKYDWENEPDEDDDEEKNNSINHENDNFFNQFSKS